MNRSIYPSIGAEKPGWIVQVGPPENLSLWRDPTWQFCDFRDLFGMVSSRDPNSKANRDLQRSGIKRSRIESPGSWFSFFSRVNQFRLSFKKILPVFFGIESLFHSQVLGLPLVDNFDKAKQLIRLSKVEGNPILQWGEVMGGGFVEWPW